MVFYWLSPTGVNKDGQVRHFFHRPSKAYTTGTRKRRKVHTDEDGSETRWHKTGKTRPVLINGRVRGYKKILVLYTNYGKQKKPEKTNWVMHQYHLGIDEEERDGELVVSKVFYQTQPRQCGTILKINSRTSTRPSPRNETSEYYSHPSIISFDQRGNTKGSTTASTAMFPFCCPWQFSQSPLYLTKEDKQWANSLFIFQRQGKWDKITIEEEKNWSILKTGKVTCS